MNQHALTASTQHPGLTFQPETYRGLLSGISCVVDAIAPTLGPAHRVVAMEQADRRKQPELLDNGALIARRITQIPGKDSDMGAMLLRQVLWQLYEEVGDGSATASVIFRTIVSEGIRYITAGGDAQQLRTQLLDGLKLITAHLQSIAIPIRDDIDTSQFALSLTHHQNLADILVEVFDTLGAYARVDLRNSYSEAYTREYVQGILWEGGVHSTAMLLDGIVQRTELENIAIFISDLEFNEAAEILPIVDIATHQYQGLVIVASKLSEKSIGLINYINQQPKPFKVIAVKLPEDRVAQLDMLEDLVQTVGGRIFRTVTGDNAGGVGEADLGKAKKIWANRDYFCVEEANQEIQRDDYLLSLETQYHHAKPENKDRLLRRIGRLMGASATILVGGFNKEHIRQNKEQVNNYLKVIRSAYEKGLVSGGGTALLHCQPVLEEALAKATSADGQAAYRILIKAIKAPAHTILENAGYYPGVILEQIGNHRHYALDENACIQIADSALILDSVEVVMRATQTAIRTAALSLSVDVLVHHRNPEFSATP